MPSRAWREEDVAIRDSIARRQDGIAPAPTFGSVSRPQRPPYRAEEGEAGRHEWLSLAKALMICVIALLVVSGLGMQVMSLVATGDTTPPLLSLLGD